MNFQGISVMAWGGVSYNAYTELMFIEGYYLAAFRYIGNILQKHVPYIPLIGNNNYVLMQDYAIPHTARIVQKYLQEVEIHVMDWPGHSPDLNSTH